MKIPNAAETMTRKIQTVKMDDSIRTAFQVMQDYRIRHLPVRDPQGKIVGILSDRDVTKAAQISQVGIDTEIHFNNDDRVKDFMSWPVETVTVRENVIRIAERMIEEKKSCFLVSGDIGHEPQGIITSEDLLKTLVDLCKKEPSYMKMSLGDLWSESVLV